MKALWLENGEFSIRELPNPAPSRASDALIRVIRAEICSTDHQLQKGYYTFAGVPGHEFVGVVQKCESKPDLVGKRVVADINVVCHQCSFCASNLAHHCLNRTVVGILNHQGAFAEFLVLPTENLFVVPESISDQIACLSEPLAAALEIQEQVKFTPDHRVLVIGDGKLGLLIAQTLAMTRCQLLVVGHHKEKLAILEKMDIQVTMETKPEEHTNVYDVVVECTGSPSAFNSAISFVKPRGVVVLKSTYAQALDSPIHQVVVKELTLIGSRCGPIDKALALMEQASDHLNLLSMITHEFPFEKILEAMEVSKHHDELKVQIYF